MLARQHRFHGLGSLNFAYKRGQIVRGQLFSLRYADNSRIKEWRAAVVVSRKVHKSAIVRNRILRRIYELLRLELSRLDRPVDIIINVHSDRIAAIEPAELRELLRASLGQASLI